MLKGCTIKQTDKAVFVLLGIENQTQVHYAMPVRDMLYDAMAYYEQVDQAAKRHAANGDRQTSAEMISGFLKTDRLLPVITAVIYWGMDKWDGPRSLHEMLEPESKFLTEYVQDYKIHLIVPSELEDVEIFHSSLRDVFAFIRCASDKEQMKSLLAEKKEQCRLTRDDV